MPKIISWLVLMAMIVSFTYIPVLAEVSDIPVYSGNTEIIYEENFDNCTSNIPTGWTANSYGKSNSYIQSDSAVSGNSWYVNDDDNSAAAILTGPSFDIIAGQIYSISSSVYCSGGSVAMYLRFFDNANNTVKDSYTQITVNGGWETVIATSVAPDSATYGKVILATSKATQGTGYFDDIVVYKGIYKAEEELKLNPPSQANPVKSHIIEPVDNKLKYNSYTEYGDKLGDYSYSGFYNGEYELPDSSKLPVAAVVEPSTDSTTDDTLRLQSVIDAVSTDSTNNWFKVIKLKAGRYNIGSQGLQMKSGIILSGEGQGPDGTVIYAYAPVSNIAIKAQGEAPSKVSEDAMITDDYVESGSYEITIEENHIGDYKVGDLINIHHHCTKEWSEAMGMYGVISSTGDTTYWSEGLLNMDMERTIVKIEDNTLTLDLPFYVPMQMQESKPYIYKIDDSKRLEHIGIENLRIESYYDGTPYDENHGHTAIMFSNIKNSYVRDVSTKYFYYSAITFTYGAKQVSAVNCSSLEPVSKIEGGKRYSFKGQGNQQLFTGCYSYNGRHDYVTLDSVTGPIVFTDSVVDSSNQASENHCLWTTGTLYDNVLSVSNNYKEFLGFTNCGLWGTVSSGSHGWSAASTVAWNCLFSAITGSKPPLTYNNFMVGQWGYYDDELAESRRTANIAFKQNIYRTSTQIGAKPENYYRPLGSSFAGDCYMESPTAPVDPRSIYRAQLSERLTGDYRNTKPGAPVITTPRGETTLTDNTVVFEGLYLKGAQKVTLYIDNKAYDTKLDSIDNMFSLSVNLEDGTHRIYATQTVNGVESTKCADRFIIVKEKNGNPSYLQSGYEYDMLNPLTVSRMSFDEYQINTLEELNATKISTAEDFKNIANDLSGSYILENNITLDETYTPISNFSGVLNGNGHTIDIGYRVDGRNGLFNTIAGGTVKNLSVSGNILFGGYAGGFAATVPEGATAEFINCKNYVTVAISGAYYAGGFVGYSYKSGAVTFTNCNNYANISAGTNANVAGFVGLGSGPSFTGCANYGNITVATSSKFGGGFMGYIYGVVALDNCANFGDIVNSAGGTSMGAIAGGVGGYGSAINATNFVNAGAAYNGISGNFAATRSTATVNKFINVGATTNVIAPSTLSVVTATDAYYLADSGAGFTGATVKTKDELSALHLAGFTVSSDVYNVYYPVPSELTLTTNTVTVIETGDGTVTPNTESGVLNVLYNGKVIFTLTPGENCMVNSCKYNNKEITLTEGKYETAKIITPSVLDVSFINLDDIDVNDGLNFADVYIPTPEDGEYYGENGAKIAFAKAVSVNPYTVVECGLLADIENTLSDSELVYGGENVTRIVFELSDTVKIAPDGSYGILIYNNEVTAGKTLKVRAYAKYSNGDIAYTTPVKMAFDKI